MAEKVLCGPGPVGPFPQFLLHPGETATVRIDVNSGTGANQWDNKDAQGNYTALVDLQVNRSDDGGNVFVQETLAQIVGGTRNKAGELPAIAISNSFVGDRHYNVKFTLNKEMPFGLKKEMP